MNTNWKRGKQRGTRLVPARKVNLGDRVFYLHVYYISGERYVNWRLSVVIGRRKGGLVTIQTIYGFVKNVMLAQLFIEVP